jgi:type I restriction enzyme S subunit
MSDYIKLSEITYPQSSSLKLSQVCEEGSYPVYGASGLCGYTEKYQTEESAVAVVKDGAGIGHTYLLPEKSSALGTMQIIHPNKNIQSEYLYYLIRALNLGASYNGATIPHIYYKNYSKSIIKNHSVAERTEIIKNLSDIESVINNKKTQLKFLDELIKSRFILQGVA